MTVLCQYPAQRVLLQTPLFLRYRSARVMRNPFGIIRGSLRRKWAETWSSRSRTPLAAICRGSSGDRGRIVAAIVAIAVAYLLTSRLPDELNLLIPYDVGVAVISRCSVS
jgi:hypothetical protein